MKLAPDTYVLSREHWSLFVTLTFVRERMPVGLRRKFWFSFLRSVASVTGVHFKKLLWVLRLEAGELNGRLHNHAVIGGLPPHMLNQGLCFRLMHIWEHQKPLVMRQNAQGRWELLSQFCGMPRVRIYDPALNGLGYCLDGLPGEGMSSEASSFSGANQYELSKFGGAQIVEFSESLMARIRVRWIEQLIRRRVTRSTSVQSAQRTVGAAEDGFEAGAWFHAPTESPAETSPLPSRDQTDGAVNVIWLDVKDGTWCCAR